MIRLKLKQKYSRSQTEFSDFLNDNANLLNTLYENIASFYSISSIYNGTVNDFKKQQILFYILKNIVK